MPFQSYEFGLQYIWMYTDNHAAGLSWKRKWNRYTIPWKRIRLLMAYGNLDLQGKVGKRYRGILCKPSRNNILSVTRYIYYNKFRTTKLKYAHNDVLQFLCFFTGTKVRL